MAACVVFRVASVSINVRLPSSFIRLRFRYVAGFGCLRVKQHACNNGANGCDFVGLGGVSPLIAHVRGFRDEIHSHQCLVVCVVRAGSFSTRCG